MPNPGIPGNGYNGTNTSSFNLANYGRLYYENPEPYVTIDQDPADGSSIQNRINALHERTSLMTGVNDQDTTVSGNAYQPSIIYPDKVFPLPDATVYLYVRESDGSIAQNAGGLITATPIGTATTDGDGKYTITIPEKYAGTQLVAQAVIGTIEGDRFNPPDLGESNVTVWNKNQPLINDSDGLPNNSTVANKVEVYQYTKADGVIGLKVTGESAKRIDAYADVSLNPATVNIYRVSDDSLLGTGQLNALSGDKNTYDIDFAQSIADAMQSGDEFYVRITDDNPYPDTVAHTTDKGFGILKTKQPNAGIAKSVENLSRGDGKYYVGDTVKYTITVSNTEPDSVWKNVNVTETLPSEVTLGTGSVKVNNIAVGDNLASIPLGDMSTLGVLAGTKEAVVTFEAEIVSGYGTTFQNTASATGKIINQNDVEENKTVTVTDAPITVQKSAVVPGVVKTSENITNSVVGKNVVGDTIKYTITVSNNATNTSTWANVVLSDTVATTLDVNAGSLILPVGATGGFTGNVLTVNLGNIANGESKVVSFEATLNDSAAGTTVYNTASAVGTDEHDDTEKPGQGTDPGKDVEMKDPVPAVVKVSENITNSVAGKNVVGDTIKYTITVSNNATGMSNWANVILTDTVPNSLTVDAGSLIIPAGATGSFAGNVLTVNLGDIANGESKVVTFEAELNDLAAGTTVYNTATANGEPGTDPGTETEEKDPVPSVVKASENITNSVAGKNVVGDTIKYTITVSNNATGTSTWANVILTDTVPNSLTVDAGSLIIPAGATGGFTGNVLTVNLGDIANGESKVVTFEVEINDTAAGTTIYNTAIANGEPGTDPGTTVEDKDVVPEVVKTSENITNSVAGKNVVGDTIKYTITVSNNATGTSTWANVILTDTVPSSLTVDAGSLIIPAGATGGFTGNVLTVNLGDIANGESKEVTFEAELNDLAAGTTVYNTATANGEPGTDPGTETEEKDPVPSVVKASENITNSVAGKNVVGDTIKYTITVSNNATGMSNWTNVVLTDTVPNSLTVDAGSLIIPSGATGSFVGNVLTVNLGDIANGESKVVTFEAEINDTAAGTTIYNTAIANGEPGTDPGTTVEDKDVVPEVVKTSENITNSVAGKNVVGDTIKYTITVSNNATGTSTWSNVVLTDTVPNSLTVNAGSLIIPAGATGGFTGNVLTVNLGDIANGESKVVTFEAELNDLAAGTTVYNTATANGEPGTDPGTETEEKDPVPSVVKVSENITNSVAGKNVVGDTIKYTITVSNNATGASTWSNVVLTDTVPNSLTVDAGSLIIPSGATGSFTGNVLTVNLGDIANGESKVVTFEAELNDLAAGTTVYNTATANGEPGTDPGTETEEKDPIPSVVKVSENITNSVAGKNVVGDTIKYTITVSNNATGTSTWSNVVLIDTVPNSLTVDAGSLIIPAGATGGFTGNVLTVNLGDIANGESKVVTFEAELNDLAAGTTVYNTATANGEPGTDPGTETEEKDPVPSVVKASENITNSVVGKNVVGDTIKYTITVSNNATGTSTWSNVVLTDTVPNSLTVDAGSLIIPAGATGSFVGNVLTVNLGDIENSESKVVTFEAEINDSAAGTTVYNTAIANGEPGTDPGTTVEDKDVVPEVVKTSENMTNSVAGKNVVGDTIKYTITVSNNSTGTSTWTNVVLTDTVPNSLTVDAGSLIIPAGATGGFTGNVLTVNLGDIANGESRVITFEAELNDLAAGTTVYNTATANGEPGTDPGTETEEKDPVPSVVKASENITNSVAGKNVVGDTIKYTITVSNNATGTSTWANVVLTDAVPNSLTIDAGSLVIPAGATGSFAGNILTVNLGDIANGESRVVTFEAELNDLAAGITVYNTATANGEPGTDPGTETEEKDPVPSVVKVSENLTNSVAGKNVVGDTIKYTITVSNNATGTSTWANVILTDTVPNSLTVNTGSLVMPAGATGGFTGNVLTVNLGDIANGESRVITFEAELNDLAAGTTVYNTATANGEPGTDPGTETEEKAPVPSVVKVSENITNSVAGKNVVGDTIKYTITVSNNATGTSTWANVILTDTVPNSLTVDAGSLIVPAGATGGFTGNVLTVNLGDIANGESRVVTFEAELNDSAAGTTVYNTATANGEPGTDPGVVVEDTESMPSATLTVKNITNTVPGKWYVGETVEYTLTIKNMDAATGDWKDIIANSLTSNHLVIDETSIISPGTHVFVNSVVTAEVGTLTPGGSLQVTFQGRILPGAEGVYVDNHSEVDGILLDVGFTVEDSDAIPEISKTVKNLTATNGLNKVGDKVEYTIKATNKSDNPASLWKNVLVKDPIPEGITLDQGSVKIDGVLASTEVTYEKGILWVDLGEISGGKSKVITFTGEINEKAKGSTIVNRVYVEDLFTEDGGIRVEPNKGIIFSLPKTGGKALYILYGIIGLAGAIGITISRRKKKDGGIEQ